MTHRQPNLMLLRQLRVHSHLALLSHAALRHECPPSPPPCWPALTLLQSNCAWARLIYRARPVFLLAFFHLLITFFNCSVVPVIYKTVADFSTAFYTDIVHCCLPEFKVNPPQTLTAMSALRARGRARASIPYWSSPLPTVPWADKACRAWVRNGALALVKQTGL